MSVILRLQNLPLSAKSGDIRNFFRGLQIPDGGVEILGGEKGDAFITFVCDEDARLAMLRDGGILKDTRIKLSLSSHIERQHEVSRTVNKFGDALPHKMFTETQISGDFVRSRSSERRGRSCSRSPHKYVDYKSRLISEFHQRSTSSVSNSRSRYRSRSPRRSRSPMRPSSSKSRAFVPTKKSISPNPYNFSPHHIEVKNEDSSHSVNFKHIETLLQESFTLQMCFQTIKKELSEAQKTYSGGGSFVPYSKILSEKKLPLSRRPLCALLTGLPLNVTTKKIIAFFSDSGLKPDAIHLTLTKKSFSDGRAFLEFTNFLDFNLALTCHGRLMDNNAVCVKQILYDEMVKILDSQNAEHHFKVSAPTSSISNEPEKVPYLWKPPDEEQDDISDIYARDKTSNKPLETFIPSNERIRTHFNKNVSDAISHVLPYNMLQSDPEIDPSYFEDDRRNKEDRSEECIVQMTNVNVSIRFRDLVSFLDGFGFYKNTFIRRFTDERGPTPTIDVRVTFHNRREAERAIQLLNGKYLEGSKINMFIVS